jgi:NADH-quinone oxidoreductase subunit A
MDGFELLSEYLTHYFPILFFVVVALFFGIWSLVVSYLVQPKYPEAEKLSSWAVVFTKIELIGLIEMLVFIGLFLVAYVYAWRKGALEWD